MAKVPDIQEPIHRLPEQQRPDCPLIGQDGNIFNLVGIAARTLRQSGQREQAREMTNRVFASGSYAEALGILGEYVNIVSVDERRSAPVRNPPEREER